MQLVTILYFGPVARVLTANEARIDGIRRYVACKLTLKTELHAMKESVLGAGDYGITVRTGCNRQANNAFACCTLYLVSFWSYLRC